MVARDRKVVAALVFDAVVESHDDISAPSPQRHIVVLFLLGVLPEQFLSFGCSRFRRSDVFETAFVDELPRSRSVFVDLVREPPGSAGTLVRHFVVAAGHRDGGCRSLAVVVGDFHRDRIIAFRRRFEAVNGSVAFGGDRFARRWLLLL